MVSLQLLLFLSYLEMIKDDDDDDDDGDDDELFLSYGWLTKDI